MQADSHPVNNGQCTQAALRGEWVMTCQSLHANPRAGVAYAAEATLVQFSVKRDGTFEGTFDSKIKTTPLLWQVTGSLTMGDDCTVEGRMTPQGIPATVIAKGLLFSSMKEFLAIPVGMVMQTPDGPVTVLNAYDSCRGLRTGR